MDPPSLLVARVVPDVTGLDKQFDYLVPEQLRARVAIGSMVRDLAARPPGRRLGRCASGRRTDRSRSIGSCRSAKWSGIGPSAEIIDLGRWASQRWGAGRLRPFLVAASPPGMVGSLPAPTADTACDRDGTSSAADSSAADPAISWLSSSKHLPLGPSLVIHPSVDEARRLAARLRQSGYSTAVHPEQWARAAGGVDVVIGGRSAVWAPCPGMRSIVVLDEHDEALQEERSPTWHARDVAIERARRAGRARACWCRRAPRRSPCSGPATRSADHRSPRSATAGRSSSSSTAAARSRGSDRC